MLDITNQRFGKLVAIKPVGKTKNGKYKWLCQCDCGNETITTSDKLRRGHTKSCGCLKGSKGIDLSGKRFGRLTAIKSIGSNGHARVWLCQCDCGKQVKTTAHQLISGNTKSCGCLQKEAALRNQQLATKAVIKNGTSKNILSTYTRSNTGIRGISYNKSTHKYDVGLIYQGKTRFRKSYDNLEDAINARKAAEKKWIEPLRHNWDKKS